MNRSVEVEDLIVAEIDLRQSRAHGYFLDKGFVVLESFGLLHSRAFLLDVKRGQWTVNDV